MSMDIAALHARAPLRPCLARVGASQIAKMRLAIGARVWADGDVGYLRDETRVMRSGHSRALLVGAGVLAPLGGSTGTVDVGTRREPEVFAAWSALVRDGWCATALETDLDPDSLVWCPAPPREWPRRIDRGCDALDTAGFDGYARTRSGLLVIVEIKCARYKNAHARSESPVWWDRGACPWWYADQLAAEMAIGGAAHSLLVVAGGWIRDEDDPRGDGPIRVFHMPRDERHVEEVREIATEAIRRIRAIRTTADGSA